MIVDTKTQDIAQSTDTLPQPETESTFHWRNCWYPVVFVQDLPKNRPYSFSLYDEPFVLFTNQEGEPVCLRDRCPHRAAKLSDGQIIDGKIECLYHGWQFGNQGECLHIPQLPADAKIPVKACVKSFQVVERQGMIWMWAGESEVGDTERIPILAELDKPGIVTMDYLRDLPYDQGFFIENVIDVAHVFIAHDGTDGNRNYAQPLEIDLLETSVKGIRSKWRMVEKPSPMKHWQNLDFIAPNLVHYRFNFNKPDWVVGLALYSIPLGQGRCRILLRRYRNFMTQTVHYIPRWFQHFRQSRILEEDMSVVVGQQAEIERLSKSLKEIVLPLKTSDTLVVEYRQWLDKFGSSLPFYQGYSTSKELNPLQGNSPNLSPTDRYGQHTQICRSCNQAYQVTNRLKQTLIGVAIAAFAFATITDRIEIKIAALSLSVLVITLVVGLGKLRTHFEQSYTRPNPIRQKS